MIFLVMIETFVNSLRNGKECLYNE